MADASSTAPQRVPGLWIKHLIVAAMLPPAWAARHNFRASRTPNEPCVASSPAWGGADGLAVSYEAGAVPLTCCAYSGA
jgi:hypothetical protein